MIDKAVQSPLTKRIATSLAVSAPVQPDTTAARDLEVELKLVGDPGAVEVAFEAIANAASGARPHARNLTSTYFDTADRSLRDKNIQFRIRKINRRYVATLKWKQNAGNSHVRGELEVRLPSPEPDMANFGPDIAEKLREAIGDAELIAQFTTRIKRRTHLVAFGGAQIEIALDAGVVVAADRRTSLCELELEIKQGELAALYELAEALAGEHNLRLGQLTKSERGVLLVAGEACAERRGGAPYIPLAASLDEIIEIIAGECLEQFTGNWPAFDGPHQVESVHQMRVALRRLRTALALFNRALPNPQFEHFRASAKSLASALGAARDMDVFIALVENGPIAHHGRDAGFDALLASATSQREIGYARAGAILRDPQTSGFVFELRAFLARRSWRNVLEADELLKLNESAVSFAERTLKRLDKRARRLGKGLEKLDAEGRHDLRIALKNIRYAAEFFGELFGATKVRKYNRCAARLQDVLGDYNDATLANRMTEQLEQNADSASARAAGVVVGWCERGCFDADAPLLDAWKNFRDAERFW